MVSIEKQVNELNLFLRSWKGAEARFNSYLEGHGRLTIVLRNPSKETKSTSVSFTHCFYICGPTSWSNANLSAQPVHLEDGEIGLEVFDEARGFIVRCGGVVVGNGELVVPSERRTKTASNSRGSRPSENS